MSGVEITEAILLANAPVSAAVNDRVFMVELPAEEFGPAIVLTPVSRRDGRHLDGSDGYPLATVIIDCIGSTFGEAAHLGNLAFDAMLDWRGTIAGFEVDDIAHTDLDSTDRGPVGMHYRRRIGFEIVTEASFSSPPRNHGPRPLIGARAIDF